ncbi:UDP-N-acetylmuramate dehydrogenase [Candidatus Uhrbacteria bacterium]|nr:UDP-N-acetylmuramate dehydrogenase [Candidatus Uhrbacteria bacterium]
MNDITSSLLSRFGTRLKQNELLSKHTNFRIGGPARWYLEAKTEADVMDAWKIAHENSVPVFVLGGGSNTLAPDEGYPGLVIQIAMRDISIDGQDVVADAGALSVAVARQTGKAGLSGMEWAISLPGTIGGAVRGNAGCFGGETKDRLVSARVLREGKVVEMSKKDLDFHYRHSSIKGTNDIVLSAKFHLEKGDADELQKKMEEILGKRKASQPMSAGSAGCMFKNCELAAGSSKLAAMIEKKIPLPNNCPLPAARCQLPAGWLIDQAGLKGLRIGDAQISDVHGNFVVNLGKATAEDVMAVVHKAKETVKEKFGIELEEEVQLIAQG